MESYIRSLIDEIFLEDNSDLRKKISSRLKNILLRIFYKDTSKFYFSFDFQNSKFKYLMRFFFIFCKKYRF